MKPVRLTIHALEQCAERGATTEEVSEAIALGDREPARNGRWLYHMNFEFDALWNGKHYRIKQVAPVVAEKSTEFVVITVYTYYFSEDER